MSDTAPSDPKSHEYFDVWDLYEKIILENSMRHREVIDTIGQWSPYKRAGKTRILDLGCGDSYVVSCVHDGGDDVEYTGVDLSEDALAFACKRLEKTNWKLNFIQADILKALDGFKGTFDLVIAGYALHHLLDAEKEIALKGIRKLVAEDGAFLIYDMMPRDGEARDPYIRRFVHDVENVWGALDDQQRRETRKHIEENDFPISPGQWIDLAKDCKFDRHELLYRDENAFYALIVFA
ncbi:class I SAM-dependent methyltransferase [Rubellicoccus peritrichatus]|uniref:Class I SAM-dependent methyltransferase n=1 Tax=Rubellicoccus peritrichatus TaxID=3080537 RepID=A0AAQ3QXH5_9BACT|nr:class I SAM-dependent methyltransferase [Puniceicoccus sp. CR14]WOO43082.1 class I SAM-dependent methyltransferase [Puniceicoccus sp. CR14]